METFYTEQNNIFLLVRGDVPWRAVHPGSVRWTVALFFQCVGIERCQQHVVQWNISGLYQHHQQ